MAATAVFVVKVVLVGVVKSLDVSLVFVSILVDKDGFGDEDAETVFVVWLQFVEFVTHSTLISVPTTNQV